MTKAFNAHELERRYAFLDDCPEQFLQEVVTLPVGTLAERVHGVRLWRDALLDGRLPPDDTWPPREIAEPAKLAIGALGILPFLKGQAALVDAIISDVLRSFTRYGLTFHSEVADELRRLEQLERARIDENAAHAPLARERIEIDDETHARLRRQAEHEVRQRAQGEDGEIVVVWAERTRTWSAIRDVFGDLGEMLGRGWDLSTSVLKHAGWTDAVRLRQLLEQLPQVREIVQSLGRLHTHENEDPVADRLFVPVRRLEEERREVCTSRIPVEARGIERSGGVARMLPVEAVNLGHPKLRYLWHARRAERALLTYRVEGIEISRSFVEKESQEDVEHQSPRPKRGPILAVIDTSGSMHGLPERVAKALVLEALRIAHAEKRRCYVYAYSGPGQIIEHELELSLDGVAQLLAFLALSFGGGNDETGVMEKVLRRLEEEDWKKADVVFVSDGEWPAPSHLIPRISAVRTMGTRFHGVQIGNQSRTGLHAICDPVHVFQDWVAVGGWR